jgi:hypothetical protein
LDLGGGESSFWGGVPDAHPSLDLCYLVRVVCVCFHDDGCCSLGCVFFPELEVECFGLLLSPVVVCAVAWSLGGFGRKVLDDGVVFDGV